MYALSSDLLLQAREAQLGPEVVDKPLELGRGARKERAHLGHERRERRRHAGALPVGEAPLLRNHLLRERLDALEARVLDDLVEDLRGSSSGVSAA